MMDMALRSYFKLRQRKIIKVASAPHLYQERLRSSIIAKNKDTEYGRSQRFDELLNLAQFKKNLPLSTYETLFPHIQRMMNGEQNLLVAQPVKWFAKSAGTTSGKSKYIPVTQDYLINGHLKCTWTAASVIYNEDQGAKLFEDKNLIMGGSITELGQNIRAGDISAILLYNFPKIGRRFYTPDFDTALIADWDEKIVKIAKICSQEKVSLLAGVPSWISVLLHAILDHTGKKNISEVWPNLRSFLHGGIGIEPYRAELRKLMPSDKIIFREVYNASEGYFAIQNNKNEDSMLLLCNHQIYYEFIPFDQIDHSQPDILDLSQVTTKVPYALVITNSAGLYRYLIGDVIEFTSLIPPKIKFLGRLQQHINTFGEELMIANVELALATVCGRSGIEINNFTVAPKYMEGGQAGAHEWAIEFIQPPTNIDEFSKALDTELQLLNSDYEAKRYSDRVIGAPIIHVLHSGTIERWLRLNNSYGGQNKLPRLSTDRKLLEAILDMNYAPIGPSSTPSE